MEFSSEEEKRDDDLVNFERDIFLISFIQSQDTPDPEIEFKNFINFVKTNHL